MRRYLAKGNYFFFCQVCHGIAFLPLFNLYFYFLDCFFSWNRCLRKYPPSPVSNKIQFNQRVLSQDIDQQVILDYDCRHGSISLLIFFDNLMDAAKMQHVLFRFLPNLQRGLERCHPKAAPKPIQQQNQQHRFSLNIMELNLEESSNKVRGLCAGASEPTASLSKSLLYSASYKNEFILFSNISRQVKVLSLRDSGFNQTSRSIRPRRWSRQQCKLGLGLGLGLIHLVLAALGSCKICKIIQSKICKFIISNDKEHCC